VLIRIVDTIRQFASGWKKNKKKNIFEFKGNEKSTYKRNKSNNRTKPKPKHEINRTKYRLLIIIEMLLGLSAPTEWNNHAD